MPQARGFTVVELIAVILIVGILAAITAPRFASTSTFVGRGYQDEVAGFLRHAQKLAIARHATLYVHAANATGLALCGNAAGNCVAVPGPDGDPAYQALLPVGVTLNAGAAVLGFDNLGRPLCPAALCVANTSYTITGDAALTVTVEPETGYVH